MATELTPRQKLLVEMAQAASIGNLDRFADDVLRYRKFRAFTISMDNEAGLQPQTPEEFDAVVDGMAEPTPGVPVADDQTFPPTDTQVNQVSDSVACAAPSERELTPQADPVAVMRQAMEAICILSDAYEMSTKGKWRKGRTTHETVTDIDGEKNYKIGEFHHADDANFCDVAHEVAPILIASLRAAISTPSGE